ncbi:MAG: AAA domain-containing protein [Rhodobacteraceae bacterium]|nr:AAA domain-containing protein [Paracoccaceae bacterium]
MTDALSEEDRKKLSGLLGFAHGLLDARAKVQMFMQTGLGVFQEAEIVGLPGVDADCEDGVWLRLRRQRETIPPEAAPYVAEFLTAVPSNPEKPPHLKPAISLEVSIETASDLEESGLLMSEDVHKVVENGIEIETRVKVILHAENCPEMRRDFEVYVGRSWSDWAKQERPVRRAIALYNDLFKLHSAIHTSEGTPPELVWGIGIARWKRGAERIDMPLIEQLVDIEIEDGGAISIRPRDIAPRLSLKPYLELEVSGSDRLQSDLQDRLAQILMGDAEFSPFTTLWEPLLDTAASKLASDAVHVDRAALDGGETLQPVGDHLRITSSWAIFGRPRSGEARAQDLEALKKRVDDDTAEVPSSIRGYAIAPAAPPPGAVSGFGIDSAVIGGAALAGWEAPASAAGGATERVSATMAPSAAAAKTEGRRVHFFPLPFNEEQGKISDMIDDQKLHVVVVSGPPGTGKSHSIANIISHQMATGKRVLVTARTPEAIAAVREKLPETLRPLAIASTGTDRESARQLQEAVTALSREVLTLDADNAMRQRATIEAQIAECDTIAEEADLALADVARANLARIHWRGAEHSPMDLVVTLAAEAERHAWFTDRPTGPAPAQMDEILKRLRQDCPRLAPDMVYAGVTLPDPEDLPTTAELIAAHETEIAWFARDVVDPGSVPTMALDSTGAEDIARRVLGELQGLSADLKKHPATVRALAARALVGHPPIGAPELEEINASLSDLDIHERVETVRYTRNQKSDGLLEAALRGAAGQKPVGFGLFNGALNASVATVRVGDGAPNGPEDWALVVSALRLEARREEFDTLLAPLVASSLAEPVPDHGWSMARHLNDNRRKVSAACVIERRMRPVLESLRTLFPFGLDLDALRTTLDIEPAILAIRGNLTETHVFPDAIARLRAAAGEGHLPVLAELGNLANALGKAETDPRDVVTARGLITRELARLKALAPQLSGISRDLDALAAAGAPDWAARLRDAPDTAPDLIPETWRAAWPWAEMTARVDSIVRLGNGDDHRARKSGAMKRRRRLLEELIRIRTLLGLKARLTGPIRQAMEAFTQAVSKIGTGKGKRAPRFIRAAQEAAKQASSAAPVWIMPEYKIPEQLPPEFGDFDLVILDEASQSDITALAALARGKKILVVGDEEQVSPSVVGIPDQKINALRAEFLDGLSNAKLMDQNASIFEITKRMHPDAHVMLREHFRCVAPIIQFSTRFYNSALVPLRVPKASERFDPPLVDVHIPGASRQGKTNASEARWIVDEIARLIEDSAHAGRDIGVISLIGNEQAEKIGRMLVEDPRVGPEKIEERRIIYGDARTMQGQERSIVFLSMVATPGHVQAQTSKPDQQRINVAMSRARDRLYLVRSVALEDLKPTDIKAHILQHFADPMPEGRVATGAETDDFLDRCGSGFEREVMKRLIEANYRVRPQVPAGGFRIDLVVEGAEDRRLAIELDGDKYHGPDVWDQDMARQAALERAGWIFWRVFGSQWRTDPEHWWRDLTATLDRLGIAPIGAAALDERFTQTVLIDPWGQAAAGDRVTAEETAENASAPAEALPVNITTSTPAATHAAAASETVVDTAPDRGIASDEDLVAGPAPGAGSTTQPTKQAATPARSAASTHLRAQQGALPLENDLFSRITSGDAPGQDQEIAGVRVNGIARLSRSVRVGSTVRLQKLGDGHKIEITLVETDHNPDRGMIGVHTPLGEALLDAQEGDEIEYRTGPYLQEVRVLRIR